jgi:hypothetical protein
MMCLRTCQPEVTTPVPHAFPAPYEGCETSLAGGGTFSVAATDTARVKDPKQCCYLFTNRRAPLGRPSTR